MKDGLLVELTVHGRLRPGAKCLGREANQLGVLREEVLSTRTYPNHSRVFLKNRCGRFETEIALAEEIRVCDLYEDIRYGCLSCAGRTPELCHFTTLEATTKGIIESSNVCVCIAWWVIIIGKITKCFRC